jgi:hypothetical protein
MMSERSVRVSVLVGLALIVFFLCGCISPQQEDQITIVDKKETKGEAVTKTLQANNCAAAQELKEELQAVNQYNHNVEITPRPGVTVNRQAVEGEIRTYYHTPYGAQDAVCVIPVQIPSGGFYSYDIEWVEVWREGIFELNSPDGREEGTYRVLQSMLCEVVAQRAEVCPTP